MGFSKKWFLVIGSSVATILTPISLVISCSKNNNDNYKVSENETLYSNIWNLSMDDIIKNSIFNLTVKDLETQINNTLKNDYKNNLIMKTYCFYLLWQAIKNPRSSSGSVETNLSNDIIDFGSFLSETCTADDENVKDDKKKTYSKFKKYIESFEYKISIINFEKENINEEEKLRDIFSSGTYVLNFKIDFWTNDEETNTKMISSKNNNKSIMLTTKMTREQRKILNSIKDEKIKELVKNQFIYQGTKLYYNVVDKKFSTIILPTNIYSTNVIEKTPNSGFAPGDDERQLFEFNWYSNSENSTQFNSYINLLLNSVNNFSTSLNNDWTNFLKKEEIISTDGKMQLLKINLNNNIIFDASKFE
ncbi:hypothetical protein ACJA28_02885 [Mesomycoplasma moatsii]|uniref:hypothetical protein n=1 Tax=Mesomycoplasma moatsii TaxID=171287 RepID=UPI0003B3D436